MEENMNPNASVSPQQPSPNDVVQNNMRVIRQDKDDFAAYCKANGMTQAEAFSAAVSALNLDVTRRGTPNRAAEIDEVKKSLDLVMDKYADSIRYNTEAEERIRQEYSRRLESRDKTIEDLQTEKERLTASLAEAQEAARAAQEAQERAEEQSTHDRETREAAEKTAEDKQRINDMLQTQLADAQEKADDYDNLEKSYNEAIAAQRSAEQALKDAQRDATEAAKQAARDAERALDQAVDAAEEKARTAADALKDQLRKVQSDADAARKDADNAKAAALAELSEQHRQDIAAIRSRLDERTDALMSARDEIASLKAQIADLQHQIPQDTDNKAE